MKLPVYQNKIYIDAISHKKIVPISESLFAVERERKISFFRFKTIEFRGVLDGECLSKFKKISKKYFYGTYSPTITEKENLQVSGLNKNSNHTVILDLTKSEEELRKGLEKKSIRWGASFAERSGLKCEVAKGFEVETFYSIYKNTAESGGFPAEEMSYISSLRDTKISKLFLIKKGGAILAGGLLLLDRDYKYSIVDLTASSEEGLKMQAMPFLYWNFIKYSKSLGLKNMDLGGYDMEATKESKMEGINKFKERFGGEITEQPVYSTNWKYPFIRRLYKSLKTLKAVLKI